MANVTIVRMPVYLGNKLIGEITDANYTHNTNDEQGHAQDGSNYFSTGNDTTEFDFNTVVPKAGHKASLTAALLGHLDVTVTTKVDGNAEKIDGRFSSRSYKSESKNGMLTGAWKFMGGAPKVV